MPDKSIEKTKQLMGALVRMKPKPHDELKGKNLTRKQPRKQSRKPKSG